MPVSRTCTVPPRPAADASRRAGFTLLEVVVGVAICALALIGLFQAGSSGLVAADVAGKTEEAIQRAQSHLAMVGREKSTIAEGESNGDDGGGFRWRLRIHPIAAQTFQAAPAVVMTLYDVEVTITWRAARRDHAVVVHTRRLGAVAPL